MSRRHRHKVLHRTPRRVRVYDCDAARTFLGFGTLLTRYPSNWRRREHPRIRLDSGRLVRGCECWWIFDQLAASIDRAMGVSP